MPETRGERIIFGICTLAIAALVALVVLTVMTNRFETSRTPAVVLPVTTGAATTKAAAPAPPPEPARAPKGVRLTLGATADTWVEVRSGSADGDVLYSGIIPQGSVERFSSTRVWVRFGAAANLTARLNGRSLHLAPGTYEALVGARGLRPLGG